MVIPFKKLIKSVVSRYDYWLSRDPITSSGHPASMIQKATTRRRILFVMFMFIVLYTCAILRVYSLSWPNDQEAALAKKKSLFYNHLRGVILDRNGIVLATNLKVAHLIANPSKILDVEEVAYQLSSYYPDLNIDDLYKNLSNKKKQYYLIKRNISPSQQQIIHDMGLPGIDFETIDTRFYPQKNITSHVVGSLTLDNKPEMGIERYFNDHLIQTTDNPLKLSLDVRVQDAMRTALQKSIKTFSATGAAGLVMDVNTGEVLAMVSLPDFNPNMRETMLNDNVKNHTTYSRFEPGSVFKIFNTAIALETGTSSLSTMYDVSKSIGTIGDFHSYKGALSVADILKKSSNIGSVRIADRFGPHVQQYYLRRLGFFSDNKIELQEKLPSSVQKISSIAMKTISFGHGISVTPIQLASSISATINGGYFIEPTLLMRDQIPETVKAAQTNQTLGEKIIPTTTLKQWVQLWQRNQGNLRPYYNEMQNVSLANIRANHGEQIFSQKTSDLVRLAMRLVCEVGGSGTAADVYGFPVIGKTGTAEKTSETGRYDKKAKISSFVGIFPAQAPRFLIYAMIDEPKPNLKISHYATGGVVAAPVIKEVIQNIAPIYNIKPIHSEKLPHAISKNMLENSYAHELNKINLH